MAKRDLVLATSAVGYASNSRQAFERIDEIWQDFIGPIPTARMDYLDNSIPNIILGNLNRAYAFIKAAYTSRPLQLLPDDDEDQKYEFIPICQEFMDACTVSDLIVAVIYKMKVIETLLKDDR